MADLKELKVNGVLLFDLIYPIGSIYETTNNDFNPNDSFLGTWEKIEGKFLLGSSSSYSLCSTGGEATHTLTVNEMPNHNHGIKTEFGATADARYSPGDTGNYMQVAGSCAGSQVSNHYSIETYGGGASHNNMPPYFVIHIWKRTA